jgi:cytochrome c oxidase subunit 4
MIAHPVPRVRTYVLVWVALICLLLLTLGSAYMNLGRVNAGINLAIAAAMAWLGVLLFLHLRSSHYLLRILAATGFFWLAILIGLSLTDFAVRY